MSTRHLFLSALALSLILSGCTSTAPSADLSIIPDISITQTPLEEVLKAVETSRYVEYSPQALRAAQSQGRAVLFFHANWCPTCRAAEADIVANSQDIPSDLTIIKVDFDTESELKDKYDITAQHTFILLDSNGQEIDRWNGGVLEDILDMI